MKISAETMNILKNFSTINSSLMIRRGSVIRTMSQARNIMAEAEVDEVFDHDFAIWDLSQFLAAVSMFKDPEFEFNEKFVTIRSSSGKGSIRYNAAAPELIDSPEKGITMPPTLVTIAMSGKELQDLVKGANVLGGDTISVECREGRIVMRVSCKKDATSHDYAIDVGESHEGADFKFSLSVENLRLLPDDYNVTFCEKKIAQMEAVNNPIRYWITLDTDSTYEKRKTKTHAASR